MSEKLPEPYGWLYYGTPDRPLFRRDHPEGLYWLCVSSAPVYSHEQMRVAVAEADALRRERDELAARLAEIVAQKPVAFFRLSDAEWLAIGRPAIVYKTADGDWREPLYSYPTPAAAPERAERLSEIERWKRIAENAQAVTAGGNDKGDYFEVPSHLIAALALALDEGLGAQGQAGAASMGIADGTKIRPAAAPERAEPAANELPTPCTECGQLGWHKFGCSHVAHERGLRVTAQSSDSTSCPRGER